MRLVFSIFLLGICNLLYLQGQLSPFLDQKSLFWINAVLFIYTLYEVSVFVRKVEEEALDIRDTKQELEIQLAESEQREAKQTKSMTLLENERDELRDRYSEEQLKSQEQAELREEMQEALHDEKERAKEEAAQSSAHEESVLLLLSMLQEKGRFIDFLMDDVDPYEDAQIGAAARMVHKGCKSVLKDHITIQPVTTAEEGASFTVDSSIPPTELRVVGSAPSSTPFTGTLLHRGWKASDISLPRSSSNDSLNKVITPAEVEV